MKEGNREVEYSETCENCHFDHGIDCPVPFAIQGQLTSQGGFYCPFWIRIEEEE